MVELKVKWNSNYSENPFGNCALLPAYSLLSVRKGTVGTSPPFAEFSSFPSLVDRINTGNRIVKGKRHLGSFGLLIWKHPQPPYHYSRALPTDLFRHVINTPGYHQPKNNIEGLAWEQGLYGINTALFILSDGVGPGFSFA